MLERAGIARPKELRGHSLTPLMHGRKGNHPGFAFSESHSSGTPTGSYMIRKGDWKYIHFTYYDDLLFNVKEDPGEFHNCVDDPKAQEVLVDLKSILFNLIDPEEITFRAFRAQDVMLRNIAGGKSEEELAAALESRLGKGQARILAAQVKGR
jgi:choline-sulfatase